GTGLYTPPATIDNDELVESFNTWVERYNNEHKEAIEAGEMQALQTSTSDFIEKASGIKRRHVIDKDGILDPDRMRPYIPERSNDEYSVQCDMSVAAR
ncbi:MAG TPA: beta-ketoacyl-ACP synthase III, partial [Marinobacter sp.]|nr:beta-ketoacyl-ACP synthase III [Marinobacter sp.]